MNCTGLIPKIKDFCRRHNCQKSNSNLQNLKFLKRFSVIWYQLCKCSFYWTCVFNKFSSQVSHQFILSWKFKLDSLSLILFAVMYSNLFLVDRRQTAFTRCLLPNPLNHKTKTNNNTNNDARQQIFSRRSVLAPQLLNKFGDHHSRTVSNVLVFHKCNSLSLLPTPIWYLFHVLLLKKTMMKRWSQFTHGSQFCVDLRLKIEYPNVSKMYLVTVHSVLAKKVLLINSNSEVIAVAFFGVAITLEMLTFLGSRNANTCSK